MAMRITLEVCVDTPEGFEAAVAGGADRIELCAALDLGGLTPSPGLMALAAKASTPVYAMIRPRAGDFVFGLGDEAAMLGDIDAVRSAGLAGVVIGANLADGRLDVALLERLGLRSKYVVCANGALTLARQDDGSFRLTGRDVERVVALNDVTTPDALNYISHRLERLGVNKLLARAGVRDGDVVWIGDFSFDYRDD